MIYTGVYNVLREHKEKREKFYTVWSTVNKLKIYKKYIHACNCLRTNIKQNSDITRMEERNVASYHKVKNTKLKNGEECYMITNECRV